MDDEHLPIYVGTGVLVLLAIIVSLINSQCGEADWSPPPVVKPQPPAATPAATPLATPPAATRLCCKHCRKGKACGNSCIPKNATCSSPPGCAC